MNAANRAVESTRGPGRHGLRDLVSEQALMLGAGSTVLYQMADLGVGLGVAEHSTTLQRPVDRLRTTLTFVYVMVLGTDEERQAIVRMVNQKHAPVCSPGRYSAYDPDLQLWVAATLARNAISIRERIWGPLSTKHKDLIYRDAQIFGTSLQVEPAQWPATSEDFDHYWRAKLTTLRSEPVVQAYCRRLLSRESKPRGLRWLTGLQSLVDRGNLDPHTREVLAITWTERDQRRYDLFWAVFPPLYRRLPRFLRTLQARLVLADVRRRLRAGVRVI